MNERVIPPRRSRKLENECVNGERDNPKNPLIYIKSEGLKQEIYSFYLRFLGEHFIPCDSCQDELHEFLYNSSKFIVGNNSYTPSVEFSRKFEIVDEAWKELVNRPATEADMKRVESKELDWWA